MPLISGLALFALAVAVHLAVWRLFRPSRQYFTLLGLYAAILAAASAAVLMGAAGPASAAEYLTFAMLYTALALAYISTFSAVQADSPSLLILLMVSEAGERGVTREDLRARLGDEILILPRIADLVSGRLIGREEARYVIRPRGTLLAAVHMWYRALLKLDKGG